VYPENKLPLKRESGFSVLLFLMLLVLFTVIVGAGVYFLLETVSSDYVDGSDRQTSTGSTIADSANQQSANSSDSIEQVTADSSMPDRADAQSDAELYPDTDTEELARLAAAGDADQQERMFDENQPADIILDAELPETIDEGTPPEVADPVDVEQSAEVEQLAEEDANPATVDPDEADESGSDERRSDADLSGDLLIAGKVINQSGRGVAGMTVRLQRVGSLTGAGKATSTGAEGKFRFENLAAGDFTLATDASQQYSKASAVVKAGVSSAELKVAGRTKITISGEITGADGEPVSGARISNPDGGGIISNTSGHYRLSLVVEPNRSYGLKINATGYREETRHVHASSVDANSNVKVDVRMVSAGGVTANGTIISATGQPVAGATVWLTSPGLNVRGQAMSDAKGEFSVPGLKPAGDYRLIINASGYSRYQQNNLDLDAQSLPLAIEMNVLPAGNITGLITDEDRNPVANFTMLVVSVDSFGQSLAVSSDDNGYFQADGIPSGEIRFQTRSVPSMSVTGLKLPEGQRVEADLVVDWGDYSVNGFVADKNGRRIPKAKLILRWNDSNNGLVSDSTRLSETDLEGNFSFSELGPGQHELVIESDGRFQQKSELFEVRTQTEPLQIVVQSSP